MVPLIAISKFELRNHPGVEPELLRLADKIDMIKNVNVYVSKTSIQLVEFICFLKDSDVHFQFYASEEELRKKFSILTGEENG